MPNNLAMRFIMEGGNPLKVQRYPWDWAAAPPHVDLVVELPKTGPTTALATGLATGLATALAVAATYARAGRSYA